MSAATALVLEAPRRLVARELPLPAVGEDDAVLRVEACGLCGTDHELYTGDLPWPPGFVPGHETVGVIEAIGPVAAARWGVAAGDRVTVAPRPACRECEPCRRGELAACADYDGLPYGLTPVDRAPGLWGGYATHHYLGPRSVVHKLPPDLDPVDAALFNPLGAGVCWGVEIPGTGPGDVVAVLGPGIRGIAAVAAAKAAGAGFVMVTGVGPHDLPRLELARELGADLAVDVARDDPVAALQDATGGLADVVVDVTAKAPTAFAQAVALAGKGGRVVVAGVRGGEVTLTFAPDLIVNRGLRLQGASGVSTAAHERALDLLVTGTFPAARIPRRTAGFADVGDLLLTMAGASGDPPPLHGVFVPR
ncbi:MAG TPA: alcohol dehydrogenase catalytic domain-containing protein [Acidimicrobiales bacterium]